jgi:benzoyl-CoA reductase/2-hydroxyglutaryl-CoA dehydratase subunit BcrC/BadD/HgdB
VKALINGMNCSPASELKDIEAKKVMEIYESLSSCSNRNINNGTNRFYSGCVMELSSKKNIQVFDGYAVLNENNEKYVRIDKDHRLEKQLLKNLNISPMIKNLISEFSQNALIQ